ncbi:MAG TPA: peroxiredoxin [Candidatus Sulfotelmatobacter sp.]|nr:peroxiredoxin [Candidatus Sulfotelmatobacter sp.]
MAVIAIVVLVLLGAAGFVFRRTRSHLTTGKRAPDFVVQAALGGDVRTFRLSDELRKGPVVLYFFPKSFTSGCIVEANAFSAAAPQFAEFGATIIGLSGDDIETQKKFSTQECQSTFLIGSDPGLAVGKQYDVALVANVPNRTSYVIAQDGTIVESFTSMFQPQEHVAKTLAAVRTLARR